MGSYTRIEAIGFALSLSATAVLLAAALGTRWGFWSVATGVRTMIPLGVILGLAGLLLSLVAFVISTRPGGTGISMLAVMGLMLAALALPLPARGIWLALRLPRIHDITTDTGDPPRFEAVLPLRQRAPNSADYAGQQIAAQQRAAYPGLQPLLLVVPPSEAFNRAVRAAQQLRWNLVQADSKMGRIEATDTTFWFGFKDDIVVRITSDASGSRVDVRSVSRVGLSDLGRNAQRIEQFLEEINQ